MSCKLSEKCDNVFACNVLRPEVELLGCNFYKPKKPMTNEEWFCTLSTEEKAEIIAQLSSYGGNVEAILEWLKQPHHSPK